MRSLYNKYDEIMSILTQLQLDILCLNETWLDNTLTKSQIHIPRYVIRCINSMPCLISSIYRLPSVRVEYYNGILDILDKASLDNKDTILSAALNIDYIMDESLSSNPVHHILIVYGISQIVTKPTRVTDKSSTLIDVILTPMPELHSYTDVYEFVLSDHFLDYTYVNSPIRKA